VKAREFFALNNDHAPPGAREQRRGGAAGRSATDDRDVVDVDLVHANAILTNERAEAKRWIEQSLARC